MKQVSIVLVALFALAIAGCGPSAEQKKMVDDLTAEVKSMADNASNSIGKLEGVAGEIAAAIAGADSLAKKYPKDTASITSAVSQLRSAKDRVTSVKDNVSAWLAQFKVPSLETMKFDQVLSKLKKQKEELSTATSEVEGALSAATTALDSYKGLASGLATKVAAKMKKK
ncbi:MAG: hypothetical protein C4326_06035 [Ignavibacteria bacterium]